MPWRLRYRWEVEWVGAGTGQLNQGGSSPLPNVSSSAQSLHQENVAGGQVVPGHGAGALFDATDITTVTNAAAADMVTQLTAQLARIQGFASGSP